MIFNIRMFGERLREVRLKNGDSQVATAKLIDVSDSQISEMENGKKTTTTEKLFILCANYNVSADYLLGLTDEPTPFKRKDEGT